MFSFILIFNRVVLHKENSLKLSLQVEQEFEARREDVDVDVPVRTDGARQVAGPILAAKNLPTSPLPNSAHRFPSKINRRCGSSSFGFAPDGLAAGKGHFRYRRFSAGSDNDDND